MTSVVPGLIKIGRTHDYEQRMYNLEHDGYRNVTGLNRVFALEVEDHEAKEELLHTIFEKSRVADTELFALDVNIVIQLLSSFEGKIIYPVDETKDAMFEEATENKQSKGIPDGRYTLRKKKVSDNKVVHAVVNIINGRWIIQKGSVLGMHEDAGVSKQAKITRASMPLDANGVLLSDYDFGECTPSHAGAVVMNQSNCGWTDWKNDKNQPIDIYRQKKKNDCESSEDTCGDGD